MNLTGRIIVGVRLIREGCALGIAAADVAV
jgi:hypothetical protein